MSLVRNSGWLFVQFAGERMVSALTVILLARILGPEVFGLSALAVAVPAIFIASARAVVDTVMAAASEDRDRLDGIFTFSLMAGLLSALASIVLSTILHALVAPQTPLLLWWAMALVPMIAMSGSVPEGLINARRLFHLAVARKMIAGLAGALASITLALSDEGLFALPAFIATQVVVGAMLAFYLARWRPHGAGRRYLHGAAREDIRLALSILTMNLCSQSLPRLAEIVSGVTLGPAMAGVMRITLQLVETTSAILYSISDSLILSHSEKFRDLNREDTAENMRATIETVAYAFVAAFMFLSMFAPEIFYILLGSPWVAHSYIMSVVALVGLFGATEFTVKSFQKALFLVREIYFETLISTCVNAVVMVTAALLFSPFIYVAYVLCAFLNLSIAYYAVRLSVPLAVSALLRAVIWPFAGFGLIVAYALTVRGQVPVPFDRFVQHGLVLAGVVACLALIGWRRLAWRQLRSA